ncbi:acyl-CoA thioesterase [Exilibacterium tricleocarpae]|uniref:Acyl-CoA thioesterase n=1 Tax=Exilibacterium tricleocarpae TaxID=2591008 RepID=A0A545U9S6_9GAMM|nr:acyl-CoA thioesterase [Exilibacterium tricleocarpae]TQV86163.1 acyl-CoA thioesterase [Exilibacterium tricleocarpae]
MAHFTYQHIVSFQDTNLVGNVYFASYLNWQGRCREMFIYEHSPSVLELINTDLALITLSCSCEYFDELVAFDKVVIEMNLVSKVQNRVKMQFNYFKSAEQGRKLVATGAQEVCSMLRRGNDLEPCALPAELEKALDAIVLEKR